jgi:hypothetical protein
MPKSNSRMPFSRSSGTVTVIEQTVMRSYVRKAKIVFFIVWTAVTLLAATVLIGKWEPKLGTTGGAVLALITGGLLALVPAFIFAAVVAAWPVLRAIWWWLPELAVTGGLFTGWSEVAGHTALAARLIITASAVGVLSGIGPVRRGISRIMWCLVSRHRIRTCFSQFIITNRTGSLPLVLGARPTPAGERLWVWLRPGLCLTDVQERTDKIAAACWATAVVAEVASASNSALVRIDIKRRDPLTGTVSSPLAQLLGSVIPGRHLAAVPDPAALDLPDIDPAEVSPNPDRTGRPSWPQQPQRRTQQGTLEGVIVGPDVSPDQDDINDWI